VGHDDDGRILAGGVIPIGVLAAVPLLLSSRLRGRSGGLLGEQDLGHGPIGRRNCDQGD
jgi:hypothetical protein